MRVWASGNIKADEWLRSTPCNFSIWDVVPCSWEACFLSCNLFPLPVFHSLSQKSTKTQLGQLKEVKPGGNDMSCNSLNRGLSSIQAQAQAPAPVRAV